jgi:hypothetical protein
MYDSCTGKDFREKYLKSLDTPEAWTNDDPAIILDFGKVWRIAPSFAKEAFAHFVKYAKPKHILKKIKFINISTVKICIIEIELEQEEHRLEMLRNNDLSDIKAIFEKATAPVQV